MVAEICDLLLEVVMKINYPIKYAAMPIIEQVGWSHGLNELEREYDVVCYIVSKCYLLKDSTKYMENGKSIKEYEVVFPYQSNGNGKLTRTIPEFNLFSYACTNSNKTDGVFDTYEEALVHATEKNEKLCEKTWMWLPYSSDLLEKIHAKKEEFSSRLAKYKKLERQMLLYTKDLEVNKKTMLNEVISFENNKIKVLSCNLYEAIHMFRDTGFVVFTVTQEQYERLLEVARLGNANDLRFIGPTKCLLMHEEKRSEMYIINKNAEGIYYLDENGSLHYQAKGTLPEFKSIDESTYVLYTTETFEDVMNSYKSHKAIDLSKIKGPSLKKVQKK